MWLLLACGAAMATPLARHQYRAAITAIEAVLQHSEQPLWYARLGTAHARLGHYDEARDAFERGAGSQYYERVGWRDHADVLRATGHCDEAAALRESFEPTVPDPASLWADIAEDWRACGESARALDAIAAAEARSADHPSVHAVYADLLRDQGRLVESAYHVEMALQGDVDDDVRPVLSSVEQRMAVGDLVGAERQLRAVVVGHMRDVRIFLLRTELWLGTGRRAEAQALASRGPWRDHEDPRVVCRRQELQREAPVTPIRTKCGVRCADGGSTAGNCG